MAISDNYKIIREFKNKSAAEIAKGTGISKQNLSNWENGRSNPGPEYIDLLSNFFGLPREVFFKDGLTKEYLENTFSVKKHTSVQNEPAIGEKPLGEEDAMNNDIYKEMFEKFVGTNSEYLVIHKDLLKQHRIVALEQFEKDKKQMEKDAKELDERLKQIETLTDIIKEITARPINIHFTGAEKAQENRAG